MIRLALVLVALAGPAAAGCFAADGMPATATYDSGLLMEYIARDGDVLTYRAQGLTSRMKDGLWPLDSESGGQRTEYLWDGDLPDLAAVIAAGGKARAEGKMKPITGSTVPVVAEVEILGEQSIDWEDCRYRAVEIRKVIRADGQVMSDGVLLYAPDAMISFRSSSTNPETGTVRTLTLKELE